MSDSRYQGSRFEMKLIGSGWLKETKTKRKYQRFIINEPLEIQAKDILCVYVAKERKDQNSPQYYIFLDVNARKMREKKAEKARAAAGGEVSHPADES